VDIALAQRKFEWKFSCSSCCTWRNKPQNS